MVYPNDFQPQSLEKKRKGDEMYISLNVLESSYKRAQHNIILNTKYPYILMCP